MIDMAGRRRHTERHRAASAIDRLLFGTELARGKRVQLEEGGVAAREAEFYVVAPDRRSYGRSDGTDVSFAAKAGCPVSRALASVPEITLETSLAQ
jgi:pimeloyl-ACP methyl ester carboxylesterase